MPGGIKVRVRTKPDLKRVAAAYRPIRAKTIDKNLEALTIITHRKIRKEAPKGKTKNLTKAIVWRKRPKKFHYVILVDRRKKGGKYESFVRVGVAAEKINPIRPRRKKALFWPGADHPVKAVYNHPGIKPNPYWDRGLKKSQPDRKAAEKHIGDDIERSLIVK